MFKTLEEVILRWQYRHNFTGINDDPLPSLGCQPEEIQALEADLGFEFHPSLKAVLQKLNPRYMFLAGFYFAGGALIINPYIIQENRHIDMDSDCVTPERVNLTREHAIYIGWNDQSKYEVWADNQTGHLYFVDPESRCSASLTESFEAFVCIAASINDHLWPRVESSSEANSVSLSWLEQHHIKVGQLFWQALIADAASYTWTRIS